MQEERYANANKLLRKRLKLLLKENESLARKVATEEERVIVLEARTAKRKLQVAAAKCEFEKEDINASELANSIPRRSPMSVDHLAVKLSRLTSHDKS